MISKKIFPIFMTISYIWFVTIPWGFLPGYLIHKSPGITSPLHTESVPILSCDGKGNGGDRVNTIGMRFVVNQSFSAIEVRLAGAVVNPQPINLKAELRNSTGFIGPSFDSSQTIILTSVIKDSTPYQSVRFDFASILVNTTQTFSLKIYPTDLSQEVFIEVNQPLITCANAFITADNTSGNPPAVGSPVGFKVLSPDPQSFGLISTYASLPPRIDGKIDLNEWAGMAPIQFDNGIVGVVNDQTRIYLLIDVTGEPVDSPTDSLFTSVDIDNNQQITRGIDKIYQVENSFGNLRFAYYTGPWPSISAVNPLTYSSRAKGFDCFAAHGPLSLDSSSSLKTTWRAHRVWELAIDLNEINALPGQTVHIGIQVTSGSPVFINTIPANGLSDFSHLIAIKLADSPVQSLSQDPGSSVVFDSQPFEITQAIQDRVNSLPLAAGKDTIARIYAHSTGSASQEPAQVYLFGTSSGLDLPGSPLTTLYKAPPTNDRSQLAGTANFVLPTNWTISQNVSLSAAVVDKLKNQQISSPQTITFLPITDPTDWIIPVNTGSLSNPIVAADDEIAIQQSYFKTVNPTHGINFIHQPWTALGLQTNNTVLDALNQFYNAVSIAYLLSYQSTGKAPFVFPDQIFGITPTGVGQSNPVWAGGSGHIAYGFMGSSLEASLAHAIDHNLDYSVNGSWGRNIPNGCNTQNTDPGWPYTGSAINETGLDPRTLINNPGGASTILSPGVPDFMSHCQSGILPTQWISPYRWKNLLNNYLNLLPYQPSAITTVYYLSGSISRANTRFSGDLNPVLLLPGTASTNPDTGNYSIQFISSNGTYPMVTFPIQFMDDPEESIDTVYFNFQVPVSSGPNPSTISKIVLKNQSQSTSLFEKSVGPNTIGLNITSPQAGVSWTGIQTVVWNCTSNQGQTLQYICLYSPDGANWFPVASKITTTSIQVDTSSLPGSKGVTAKFKLIATDGFNTNQVDSGLFTLDINPPQVVIDTPQDGQFIPPGTPIQLSGEIYDVQDGNLSDGILVWTEGNTFLGAGQYLTISLPPGLHTLSLYTINSQGKIQSSSVQIDISI